jgi:hypothetical protein
MEREKLRVDDFLDAIPTFAIKHNASEGWLPAVALTFGRSAFPSATGHSLQPSHFSPSSEGWSG